MSGSFLDRREAMHRKDRGFVWALVIPSAALAQYLLATTLHTVHTPLLGLIVLTIVFHILLSEGLRRTLSRWQSATRPLLMLFWYGYAAVALVHLMLFEGHALWSTGSTSETLAILREIRLPLAAYAPAVLIGPLLWAFAHDARTLWSRDPRDALVKGYGALVAVLILPVAIYLLGTWWGHQSWLPHVWHWSAFQEAIVALAVAVGIAATGILIGLVAETVRWRRLDARLVAEGWA